MRITRSGIITYNIEQVKDGKHLDSMVVTLDINQRDEKILIMRRRLESLLRL